MEYGLLTGLVAIVAILSVSTLGGVVGSTFDETAVALREAIEADGADADLGPDESEMCYLSENALSVGQPSWRDCAGMLIVDMATFMGASAMGDGSYAIAFEGETYTFGDSDRNIFTGQLTSMPQVFLNDATFNEDIGYWDVSNVSVMQSLFEGASSFNQDLSSWDTSSLQILNNTFMGASAFNGDVSTWKTANVIAANATFKGASSFSGGLSEWTFPKANSITEMFSGATAFNSDIGDWELPDHPGLNGLFYGASSFNQDLSEWCFPQDGSDPPDFKTGADAWTNPDFYPSFGPSCP